MRIGAGESSGNSSSSSTCRGRRCPDAISHLARFQEYSALEKQLEEAGASLVQKETRIMELESKIACLEREKEPLVVELLGALEGYNTLSSVIAGRYSL